MIETEPRVDTLRIPLYIGETLNISSLVRQRGPVFMTEPFSPKMTHFTPSADVNKPGDYEAVAQYRDRELSQYATVVLLPDIRKVLSPHIDRVGFLITENSKGLEVNIPFTNSLYDQVKHTSEEEQHAFFREKNISSAIYTKSVGPDMAMTEKNLRFTFNEEKMIVIPLEQEQKTSLYSFFGTPHQRKLLTFSTARHDSSWVMSVHDGIEEDILIGEGEYAILAPAAMTESHQKWVTSKHGDVNGLKEMKKEEKRIPKPQEAHQFFT
jgi:hypothetical protein